MEKVNGTYLESKFKGSYEKNYIYVLYQGSQGIEDIGVGSIFQIENISPEIVENMHSNGKIVCVSGQKQSEQFYREVYDLNVDMIMTDQPRKAHETL
jgi:glycerophosphoryl diester phosphodiesterase